jgi:5-formyltetrahydrofolate cyclo-ligase
LLELAAGLSPEYIAQSDGGIYDNVSALPEFLAASTVLFYFSVNREPDTRRLITFALGLGKTAALPISLSHGEMHAHVIETLDCLTQGRHGIPEPPGNAARISKDLIDLIIVPAVSYDRLGYRLGYGGGYYDRYLPGARAFTVGLAREALIIDGGAPREEHDVPVRCLITETHATRLR